jgi:hypothetical protein
MDFSLSVQLHFTIGQKNNSHRNYLNDLFFDIYRHSLNKASITKTPMPISPTPVVPFRIGELFGASVDITPINNRNGNIIMKRNETRKRKQPSPIVLFRIHPEKLCLSSSFMFSSRPYCHEMFRCMDDNRHRFTAEKFYNGAQSKMPLNCVPQTTSS